MMNDIVKTLDQMIALLQSCGWNERAAWFVDKKAWLLQNADREHEVLDQTLKEIKSSLAGQGSFTDIPLSPAPDSDLTRDMLRRKQWDLARSLDLQLQQGIEAIDGRH